MNITHYEYYTSILASAKLNLKRFGHSISSINGKLYLIGGALNDYRCTGQIVELTFQT